ncbi:MAG: type I-E CRISPR-associated endonuclease Cas1e [Anaerolineales bacterium]
MDDLRQLPKLRDSISYLYIEQAIINRHQKAVEAVNEDGRIQIPAASLSVLMLGPGTSITHAAVSSLAENGCSILWVGEEATRFYAQGLGETRKAYHLLRQAAQASDPAQRELVVRRMYVKRFLEPLEAGLTLPQVRGLEGVRVRRAYQHASQQFGVKWYGRRYDRKDWGGGDPVNRALSAANAVLHGICHAAIVSGGYSTAIGFIHTGKQLSFVYDVADLYKVDLTIPVAFEVVAEGQHRVERRARELCRQRFRQERLLQRILPDIDELLGISIQDSAKADELDSDPALPEALWEALEGD